MSYTTEEPTSQPGNSGGIQYTHPAFGGISITRPSAGGKGVRLFNSAVGHNDFVCIQISTASEDRLHNHTFIHQEDTITEFYMSEAQWAHFVSTGSGQLTPITFRVKPVDGYQLEHVAGIAATETMKQTFSKEMHQSCKEYVKQLVDLKTLIEKYADVGKATKTQLKEIAHELGVFTNNLPSNMAYTQNQFAEAMEKTTEAAKTDIEAFVLNLALKTGLDVLRERQFHLDVNESAPDLRLPDGNVE